ncbi:MAG TPA: ATP-binding cassette domain-containing protein, partial [Archangium sp.]|nr:ATP-binding cassette domain-containing protein [Archangium sp.]
MSTEPLLVARGIHKRFPGVHSLAGVDFDVRPGEVHALMGQNGAGKSTLIKVLTGVYRRDGGSITFEGRDFSPASPAQAQRQGISTIYQEVNLIPTLTVAENLFLGRMPRRWYGIDWRTVRRKAREVLAAFDLDIDVDKPLGTMSTAIQQLVSIARAVDTDARLIIMDEPTSSLDAHECEVLFGIIGRLKARGLGIIFVTHFLEQVYRVSDRVTILRNGALVGTYEASKLSRLDMVAHMLGRTPEEPKPGNAPGAKGE